MNFFAGTILALAAIFSLAANAQTDLQEEAQKAFNQKDYATALQKLSPLAATGDRASLNSLGVMYLNGLGVAQDYAKALNLLSKSAEQGFMKAQHNLGVMYSNGLGVPQDYVKAFEFFRLSAEQGYMPAQYNLGVMYESGKVPPESDVKKMFSKILFGSNLREPSYEEKKQKLMSEALQWYTKAAEQGDVDSQKALVGIYQGSYKPLADAAMAFKWNKVLAEAGDQMGQYNLGVSYADGLGVSRSYPEAMRWYLLASAQGSTDAQNNIAGLYLNGNGVPKSEAKAFDWYQKAAAQGDDVAQSNLGLLYWKGQGVTQDFSKATYWFEKAASAGNKDAAKHLNDVQTEIANIRAQDAEREMRARNLAQGYKYISFTDFLLDADASNPGTKIVVRGFYKIAGQLETLAESIQAAQMQNSSRIFLLSEGSPREVRKKMLDLRNSPCGYAGVCLIEVLGRTSKCSVTWMGRPIRDTTCLAIDDVRQ